MPLISTVSFAIDFNFLIFSSFEISSPSNLDALLTVDCTKISGSIENYFSVNEKKRTKNISNFSLIISKRILLCFYFFPITIVLSFNDFLTI